MTENLEQNSSSNFEPGEDKDKDRDSFDVIIAGAGLSGILSAARILMERPDTRIVLLDRRDGVGGRLGAVSIEAEAENNGQHFSYGLDALTPKLLNFINETIKSDPDAEDLADIVDHHTMRFGLLSGGKISEIPGSDIFSADSAKKLGGRSAAKEWENFEKLFAAGEDKEDQPVNKMWKTTRKNPGAVVATHIAAAAGITDIWHANNLSLKERRQYFAAGLQRGLWKKMLLALANTALFKRQVTMLGSARIVDSEYEAERWTLTTEKGAVQGGYLVVAQPPWQALHWLPRSYWPKSLLNMSLKTHPISAVTLTDRITGLPEGKQITDLIDLIIMPAETAQVLFSEAGEVIFRAIIPYEVTLDAPEVVKAIRRLRRAKKKILSAFEGLTTDDREHIALIPAAWAQSTLSTDRHLIKKIDSEAAITGEKLSFCGDAYGASYDGDQNLIQSLLVANHAICTTLTGNN